MVQLKVLSGQKAGTTWVARRFPVRIGRSAAADLQLEEDGVWDQHLQLDFNPAEGIVLSALPNALAAVNGQPVHRAVLRNGDAIDIGSLRMRFWLSETRQVGLRFREGLTWAGIAAICLGQVGLIYWLLH
jgi:pSer/pThr/pTyr-binding forkhead associated (FHA) protein